MSGKYDPDRYRSDITPRKSVKPHLWTPDPGSEDLDKWMRDNPPVIDKGETVRYNKDGEPQRIKG
jgi:hypothetical protein